MWVFISNPAPIRVWDCASSPPVDPHYQVRTNFPPTIADVVEELKEIRRVLERPKGERR